MDLLDFVLEKICFLWFLVVSEVAKLYKLREAYRKNFPQVSSKSALVALSYFLFSVEASGVSLAWFWFVFEQFSIYFPFGFSVSNRYKSFLKPFKSCCNRTENCPKTMPRLFPIKANEQTQTSNNAYFERSDPPINKHIHIWQFLRFIKPYERLLFREF